MRTIARVMLLVGGALGCFVAGWCFAQGKDGRAPAPNSVVQGADSGDPLARQDAPGTGRLTSVKQRELGLSTEPAVRSPRALVMRTTGRVTSDEARVYPLNAASDGWIRDAFPSSIGLFVQKHQPLASFYTPEFLAPQQALLFALAALDRFAADIGESPDQLQLARANIQASVDMLHSLGMDDVQITELKKTRQLTQRVVIRSPVAGVITARNVAEGLRFTAGDELYRVVDLRRVWVLADLFGRDAEAIRPGDRARVTIPGRSEVFAAVVSDALPRFDSVTQTLKLRLEADNPGYALVPEMFVDVELAMPRADALTVPADAVIDSGMRRTVFVDGGNGRVEPRSVQTGWRRGDRIEVTHGLSEGERVVVSGTFLLDAESRRQPPQAVIR